MELNVAAPKLQIQVDSDVLVDSGDASRPLMEVIRRRLRQGGGHQRKGVLPVILETRDGKHRLPQGLLSLVTEACIRKQVKFTVEDRRAMAPCPALRYRCRLAGAEAATLNKLLLREAGVLVAPRDGLEAVALDLLARRQQRTLILAHGQAEVARWIETVARSFGISQPNVAPLARATEEARVVVARYRDLLRGSMAGQAPSFGMVIFDGLDHVDAQTLMASIRGADARFLLGLGEHPERGDGLHDPIHMALGGEVQRLEPPTSARAKLHLSHRVRVTNFTFNYTGGAQYQALLAALVQDEERAALVLDDIAEDVSRGHKCVVLSDRRHHLERLTAGLQAGGLTVGCLTSKVGVAARRGLVARFEGGELQVLLCMRSMAQEALVTSPFSRLYLTFPFKHVQGLSRAIDLLLSPAPGKTDAALVDYIDIHVEPLKSAFAQRQQHIKRLRRQADDKRRKESQLDLPF